MLLVAGFLSFLCSLFQVAAFSLFHPLIQQTERTVPEVKLAQTARLWCLWDRGDGRRLNSPVVPVESDQGGTLCGTGGCDCDTGGGSVRRAMESVLSTKCLVGKVP